MARILVVEDNPVMANAIADVLELAGHEPTIACDGEAGLAAIPRVGPELIISDVMMPRMDGFEFFQAVRSNPAWLFIPFIFLTAKGQTEDIILGKRLGADDYLVKPYAPENLIATVESKLTRAKSLSRAAGAGMEEMKRTVTHIVGHELRTPLTWIQAYAELLLGSADSLSPEELNASLKSIKAGSDRLARLAEDAVLLISLDTGQALEEFNVAARVEDCLSESIAEAVKGVSEQATSQAVQLLVTEPAQLPPVLIYPRHFAIILNRLIENGIKFARPDADREVHITVQAKPEEVEIIVADNGIGIPAEQLARVFEPLVQVDRRQWEQQGLGLGLAVVRGLIALHEGRIWIESQEGSGTQVHIILPSAEAEPT